ncbi:MAG: GAF domain-containing protein, partial [Candidatus Muiribacteriota bacterium]
MSESRIKFLLNVIHELYTIDDLSEIVNTIVEKTSKIFQAERVSLMLYSEEENKLRIAASKGISSSIVKKTEIKIGEQISGIALKEKKYFFVEDINSVIKDYNLKKKRNLKTSYIIVIPLLAGEKIVGTLNITEIKYPEKIKKRDRETLIDFSHHIGL